MERRRKLRFPYVVMFYSAGLVLSFYLTWFFGRVALGYWPRPSLDDPKAIETFGCVLFMDLTGLLIISAPLVGILAALSFVLTLALPRPQYPMRLLESLAGVAAFSIAILFLWWDPNRVVTWFFD